MPQATAYALCTAHFVNVGHRRFHFIAKCSSWLLVFWSFCLVVYSLKILFWGSLFSSSSDHFFHSAIRKCVLLLTLYIFSSSILKWRFPVYPCGILSNKCIICFSMESTQIVVFSFEYAIPLLFLWQDTLISCSDPHSNLSYRLLSVIFWSRHYEYCLLSWCSF